MQTCISLKGDKDSFKILSIGGEKQEKHENSSRDDDDDIHDVADVRIMSVRNKNICVEKNNLGNLVLGQSKEC